MVFGFSFTEVKMSQAQPNSIEIFAQVLENIPDPRPIAKRLGLKK